MYQQDWLMRQIQGIGDMLGAIIFQKADAAYKIQDEVNHTDTDVLYLRLAKLLADGKLCQAEDLLLEAMDPKNNDYLLVALDFYQQLNDKTDEELAAGDFSRQEIEEGLTRVGKMVGLEGVCTYFG